MLKRVEENPYIPSEWGANQKGMQAGEEVEEDAADEAVQVWLMARDEAVSRAEELLSVGIHKQLTNRLLEPFMWHTVIVTATEWDNFFHLRCHPHAHPDIRIVAEKMRAAMTESEPSKLDYGEWHLPLVDDLPEILRYVTHDGTVPAKISVGRCARVSYLTHDGKRDPEADIGLHDSLLENGHMSPFEHVARPASKEDTGIALQKQWASNFVYGPDGDDPHPETPPADQWHGNFRGWVQYRKTIAGEHDILGAR
jgi:thymidylate synthase ThyX